jgi:hypothetical protein
MVEHRQSLNLKTEGMIICFLVRSIAQHRMKITEEYGTVVEQQLERETRRYSEINLLQHHFF